MIKQFCDVCGQEITDKNAAITMVSNRPLRFSGLLAPSPRPPAVIKFQVDVIHTLNDVGNGGNVCKYCLIDGVRSLDDRADTTVLAKFPIWKQPAKETPAEDGAGAATPPDKAPEAPAAEPGPAAAEKAATTA